VVSVKTRKMESASVSSCYSDPNFAIICGFFEKFGKMCGISFPLSAELVEMLDCDEGGKLFVLKNVPRLMFPIGRYHQQVVLGLCRPTLFFLHIKFCITLR